MKCIPAIAGRELRSLFVSPIAYVILVLFAALAGFFFLAQVSTFQRVVIQLQAVQLTDRLQEINLNQHVLTPFLSLMGFVLQMLIPAVTMGLFAAEKSNGTQELLLTSPITIWELVLGKFLAAAVFAILLVALLALFPLILLHYGDPEWGKTVVGLGALALLSTTYVAVGAFASAVTRSQLIAFFLALAILLVLLVLSLVAEISVAGLGGAGASQIAEFLRALSTNANFLELLEGLIDTRHIAYFALMIATFLVLTRAALESVRWR